MKPTTFKKIIFENKHAVLIEQELPTLETNQVLVKAHYSLVSPGTEKAALIELWDDEGFRANPGYALAGEVIEVGKDVDKINIGDKVITLMNHANYSITSTDPWQTLVIPDGVRESDATFLPLASVALHAIRRAELKLGDTFAVIGVGIIGLIAIQLAKISGAKNVIALDLADNRLEFAQHYGADSTINPKKEDAVERLMELTDGKGASVILEATGNTFVIPLAMKLASNSGKIVCVGVMEQEAPIAFHKEFIQKELSLIASYQPFCPISENTYWNWTQQANRRYLLELMKTGALKVNEMITHRFKASQAPDVYEKVKIGDTDLIGILLDWN